MTNNGNGSRPDSCDQNLSNSNKPLKPHERIRDLNDKFRQSGNGGTILITRGIEALGNEAKKSILSIIQGIDEFTPDNDPYGSHDFGSVRFKDHIIFWKIDCYDIDLLGGSPDPSDPTVTRRVMTILLAEEY